MACNFEKRYTAWNVAEYLVEFDYDRIMSVLLRCKDFSEDGEIFFTEVLNSWYKVAEENPASYEHYLGFWKDESNIVIRLLDAGYSFNTLYNAFNSIHAYYYFPLREVFEWVNVKNNNIGVAETAFLLQMIDVFFTRSLGLLGDEDSAFYNAISEALIQFVDGFDLIGEDMVVKLDELVISHHLVYEHIFYHSHDIKSKFWAIHSNYAQYTNVFSGDFHKKLNAILNAHNAIQRFDSLVTQAEIDMIEELGLLPLFQYEIRELKANAQSISENKPRKFIKI